MAILCVLVFFLNTSKSFLLLLLFHLFFKMGIHDAHSEMEAFHTVNQAVVLTEVIFTCVDEEE